MYLADGCIRFHRAQFLDVLIDHLPDGIAHFGKRLTKYTDTTTSRRDAQITLHFADGSAAECDLLLGCDGIKSNTRAAMYSQAAEVEEDRDAAKHLLSHISPVWTGNLAYRSLFETERLTNKHPGHRVATDQLMVRDWT